MNFTRDRTGVSPVISVILMVAITIVLAGLVTLWVFSLSDTNDHLTIYKFEADIYSQSDEIHLSLVTGDLINTTSMVVKINATDVTVPTGINLSAGDVLVLDSPIGLEQFVEYQIKVIIDNTTVWEGYFYPE